jgi:hypothetical protein
VAAFADGSRILAICPGSVRLFSVSGDVPSFLATTSTDCSVAIGYDFQQTGTGGNLHIACQGTESGVIKVNVSQNSVSGGSKLFGFACDDSAADVCLQNFFLGCDPGGIVCESNAQSNGTIVAFSDAGCGPTTFLVDPLGGPEQCAHVQTGGNRFWVVSSGSVELVKPTAGTVTGISLPFTATLAVPNPETADTAYVVGVGGTAEVDNQGAVLRSETGIAALNPSLLSRDNVFVPATSPQVCGSCP